MHSLTYFQAFKYNYNNLIRVSYFLILPAWTFHCKLEAAVEKCVGIIRISIAKNINKPIIKLDTILSQPSLKFLRVKNANQFFFTI